MRELKPKACPICKGQKGGIGSDGVENDCMECFKREMKAATPRVEACIDAVMARFTGESKAALARYYEEVHQHLAPLARNLELELAEVKAELARRAQPEATKPSQDLSAALLAMNRAKLLPIWDNDVPHKLHVELDVIFKALAALASPANALVAGDREKPWAKQRTLPIKYGPI